MMLAILRLRLVLILILMLILTTNANIKLRDPRAGADSPNSLCYEDLF